MRISVFLTSLSIGLTAFGGAMAQQIGTVATITPQMQGQPPGGALRNLGQGSAVVSDQRIVTGQNGRGQLLFMDETTLSIASRSEIVLDRFVYDPNRNSGEVGLSLTRGALRFIGGRATDRQPAEIRTPTGTVSIRGSTALVLVQNGRTIAVFVAGKRMCFQVIGGKRHCTNRAGGVLDESGYRGKVRPDDLGRLLRRIDGAPGRASGTTAGSGTGIANSNTPDRGPVSSQGETYDQNGPDSTFGSRARDGILPNGLFGGAGSVTEEDPPVVEEQDPPAVEEEDPPAVEEEDPPAVEEEDPPAVEEEDPPAVEEEDPPAVEEEDPPVIEQDEPIDEGNEPDLDEIVEEDEVDAGDLLDDSIDQDNDLGPCGNADFVSEAFGGSLSDCINEFNQV